MEERTKYHAPQSDSPIPYAAGRVLRAGWPSTSDEHLQRRPGTEQSAKQIDNDSCGVFCLSFLDSIICGLSIFGHTTQEIIDKLRKDYAFKIFLNSTDLSESMKSE